MSSAADPTHIRGPASYVVNPFGRVEAQADPGAIRVTAGSFFVRGAGGVLFEANQSGDVLATRDVRGGRDIVATRDLGGQLLNLTAAVTEGTGCTAGSVGRFVDGTLAQCFGGLWRVAMRFGAHGTACPADGLLATDPSNGEGMICKAGAWTRLSSLMSAMVMKTSTLVGDGAVISKPYCQPTGPNWPQALLFVIPQTEGSDDGSFNRFADDNGASWTVRLKKGSTLPLVGATALAAAYCYYPGI